MKATEFCFWLQGLFELTDTKSLNEDQTEKIRRHLNLVFLHDIDPKAGDQSVQDMLNQIHSGKPPLKPGGGGVIPGSDIMLRC